MAAPQGTAFQALDSSAPHQFLVPAKLINQGSDLSHFLVSQGYHDIVAFIALLNRSMFPQKTDSGVSAFKVGRSRKSHIPAISRLKDLISVLDRMINEAPPDTGPRRFGNVSFRTWSQLVEARSDELLKAHLPSSVIEFPHADEVKSLDELRAYFLGSFGSAQRLDYGTGHELSFLAFIAGLWKLGSFTEVGLGDLGRDIVSEVIQPYLQLIRKLILTYTLEPAGTHGVWGLDDHSFVSYLLGSAQLGPAITIEDPTPLEGSLPGAPDPGDIVKPERVQALRGENLYFGAVGFIYDVKKGPFWEHSPTLYDISGVKAGWGKINKGMVKMYNAEVLSKFPVVQHFPFGSLFRWDRHSGAPDRVPDVHSRSQPQRSAQAGQEGQIAGPIDVTSTMGGVQTGLTRAPWAQQHRTPASIGSNTRNVPVTQAPWAKQAPTAFSIPENAVAGSSGSQTTGGGEHNDQASLPTKAPWAR